MVASAKRGVRGTLSVESDESDDELADVKFRVKGVGLFFSLIAVAASQHCGCGTDQLLCATYCKPC